MRATFLFFDLLFLPLLVVAALVSRLFRRNVDVGLGPVPLINSVYHKRALALHGYSAETFVDSLWGITQDFDVTFPARMGVFRGFAPYILSLRSFFRYRALYVYFCGGPLRLTTLLCYLEPLLYRLAGIRTMVTAFGADVNVVTRTPNLLFRHALAQDYPGFRLERRRTAGLIDAWTRGADFVLAGCDWVDYLYHWDELVLAHFSIDTEQWAAVGVRENVTDRATPLRFLHAPNHRTLKGTQHVLAAFEALKAEGVNVDLQLLEGVPNHKVHEAIAEADVVVDQLVIGAYAMFALEGMASAKPVVCHMRADLRDLFAGAGVVDRDGIPLIEANVFSIKDVIRHLEAHREILVERSARSRAFVEKHHSLPAIGALFDRINREMGLPA